MHCLGIDIGGTKVSLRVVGDDGQDPYETTFRWTDTRDAARDVDLLAEHVDALRARWAKPIDAVGVAMPGTMDAHGRVVAWPGRPAWAGFDLSAALRALFPATAVRCADDGDLAALAEAHQAGCEDLVYFGVGTGIGGGIVLGGRPCPGPERGSCEVGHIIVDRLGPVCDCGRRGCVQAVASGPACLRRAADLLGSTVEFARLREAFAAGDSWAVNAIGESCAALAAAVVSVCELVRPQVVHIGGGFATGLPGFVSALARETDRLARPGHPAVPVRQAALGGLSSLHGAVLLARDTL